MYNSRSSTVDASVDAALALAHRLRQLYGGAPAREIARVHGVGISTDLWRVACGRVIYFAECSFNPPMIVLNTEAIELAARSSAGCSDEEERRWFTQARIAEVIIAHELYHILTRRPSSPEAELSAHEFARGLTRIPFSPLRYEAALRQAIKEGQVSDPSISSRHTPPC